MKKGVKRNRDKANHQKIHDCIRVSTGIPQFDKLIEGGFEKDSVNLIVGGPGSGKTILATQFIVDGLESKEHCLYISFEENKENFYHNMRRFGWDLQEYEQKGFLFFINYAPEKIKSMLEEGGGLIESIILKNKITRVVIDSLTSFTMLFEDEVQKREKSLELFSIIKKWGCTSLVTFEDSGDEEHIHPTIEFEADAIIGLELRRTLLRKERYIEVIKMRGTKHAEGLHKYTIGTKGIILKSSSHKGA